MSARPVELSSSDPDLAPFIRSGDGVVWGQACAEPVVLVDAFLRLAHELTPLAAFIGLAWRELAQEMPASLRVVSYGSLGRLGALAGLEVIPCHFSSLPSLFAEHRLPSDVTLLQVSPPDARGRCSLGVGVDYLADALQCSRTVIAEVNDHCPRSGGAFINWDRLDAVVRTSRPLLEAPTPEPGPVERRIAEHVAEIVEDGDTIQVGVGALPEAILSSLSNHVNLGVHSGMISDGVLDLIERGAVTNSRKPVDRWLTVTGAALGSSRLFDALSRHEEITMSPVSYTHAPETLARVGPLAAINSALQVDLTGQVNAEEVAGRRLGAIGGQVDFLRAAGVHGGKAIIALPSRRIVSILDGPVSTARSDVSWVVTEHGACSLRGLSESGRTRQLLRVAGQERAEELVRAAALS
jgi:acyl-CoA hydrolase